MLRVQHVDGQGVQERGERIPELVDDALVLTLRDEPRRAGGEVVEPQVVAELHLRRRVGVAAPRDELNLVAASRERLRLG